MATGDHQSILLDTEQGSIAATIAGVAHRQAMPPVAVTVAYAAAMQESKLHNLNYGDRDSVGVFQQRPSEGWGQRQHLEDPVYATTKFFRALRPGARYQQLPVYQAAQAVQHSADGAAYKQYQPMAAASWPARSPGSARTRSAAGPARPAGTGRRDRTPARLARTFGTAVTRRADRPAAQPGSTADGTSTRCRSGSRSHDSAGR